MKAVGKGVSRWVAMDICMELGYPGGREQLAYVCSIAEQSNRELWVGETHLVMGIVNS